MLNLITNQITIKSNFRSNNYTIQFQIIIKSNLNQIFNQFNFQIKIHFKANQCQIIAAFVQLKPRRWKERKLSNWVKDETDRETERERERGTERGRRGLRRGEHLFDQRCAMYLKHVSSDAPTLTVSSLAFPISFIIIIFYFCFFCP